jgi:hypothetical protein
MKSATATLRGRREQDAWKYVGPDGVKFDIVNAAHARSSWRRPV